MSFEELEINYSYETGAVDPVSDFYIPVLSESCNYDRIAGYFSSSSLAVSARGIAGLIKNNGMMRLIVSPNLSKADIEIIKRTGDNTVDYSEKKILDDLENIEDEFQKDHIKALGWLLLNGLLEIKLAFIINEDKEIKKEALFHQKIGILKDLEGNYISFSGSINETASGWLSNIEEFKVFKSWVEGQKQYLIEDQKKFDSYWNSTKDYLKIIPVSDAIRDKLVKMSDDFEVEEFIASDYIKKKAIKEVRDKLSLFSYQKKAVDLWQENECKLLFEMATGTGKTRTAIGCINNILDKEERLICIVSCPQGTLSRQWKEEIEKIGLIFDESLIIDGTNKRWRNDLKTALNKIEIGYFNQVIIYTTHTTCSKFDFIELVENISNVQICFIGDEAHGLGASVTKRGLSLSYKYRIGLSATPQRWFDEIGSKIILEYFGNKTYQFTIADALTTINPLTSKPFLVNYYYNPVFIELTDDEFYEYEQLTKKINRLATYNKDSEKYQKVYESLLFVRANIQKNAINKYEALRKVLDEIGQIKDMIIFVASEQMDETMEIMKEKLISAHRFTQSQSTKSEMKYDGLSERQYLIKNFKKGIYQSLVAIKCLDEGIDIPSADTAILMASSTNPREYIQRIGRVIRQSEGKLRAHIYDFIIEPNSTRIKDPELREFEIKIFKKELKRVEDMSTNSLNNADVLMIVNNKIRRF